MTEPAATAQDLEHLRLLSTFHYVLSGITAVFSLLPIFHVIVGILIATGGMDSLEPSRQHGHGPPAAFGWLFAIFGCAFIAFGLTLASLMFVAARRLARRRSHMFCMIVAGVSCIMMPFGTVLGVFTLIVLARPQVKALFDVPATP